MSEPRKMPFFVPKGEVIGHRDCPECGGKTQVEVMVSGTIYANCPHASAETGEKCGFQMRYGAAKSRRLREQYLIKTGKLENPRIAANDNRPPHGATEAAPATKRNVAKPEAANDDRAPVTKRTVGGLLNDYGL